VRTVVDIGANIGAATVWFARNFQEAKIFAFEPCSATFNILQRNLHKIFNASAYNFGLFDRDCEMPLYISKEDPVTNSVALSSLNTRQSVTISLKSAQDALRQRGVDTIDILKIDTEGCEIPILEDLKAILPQTRVIYLEYHDEEDRIKIDSLLRDTHILVASKLPHPHRGEMCYVAYNAFPSRPELDALRIAAPSRRQSDDLTSGRTVVETSPPARPVQEPFIAAVVIPTILRPSLMFAVESVFAQSLPPGCGQLLIGIDKAIGDRCLIDQILANKPDNWAVTVLDLQYSTSVRHGGLHAAQDGGALRTVLSYCANSRYIAYLDDDNRWAPDHLSSLLETIAGHDYAYTYRWFVDPASGEPLVIDTWESVGPLAGIFANRFGGFVDPNTLMIDKTRCESTLPCWTTPIANDPIGKSADRRVFRSLNTWYSGKCTGTATCFYKMDPGDAIHQSRLARIRQIVSGNN
jgi:FkbM family methyltransferase